MAESYSYMAQLQAAGKRLDAFVARPLSQGSFPGIVMGHEWAGLVDNPKVTAVRLAREGYIVVVPDLFDGKIGRTMEECKALSEGLPDSAAMAGYRAGLDFLKTVDSNPAKRLGAWGFCMSGRHMYLLAAEAADLSAVVVFYGRPMNTRLSEKQPVHPVDVLPRIRSPLIGVYGEADISIPMDQVAVVRDTLQKHGKTFEVHTYPGAVHAFANDTNPERYNAQAAADARARALAFLQQHLKG